MALTTRPKPKVQHKKRAAKHHRQSRHYLKAYHPYLPVVGVLGLGYLAHRAWPSNMTNYRPGSEGQTRIETLAGDNSDIALLIVIVLAGSAFAVYSAMHWYRVKRILNNGERFAVKHPWLDVALVAAITIGVVLTRFNTNA
jgi:hypothetical protein